MTDSSDTTPPPGPLPSVLPRTERPPHVEAYDWGRAIEGLQAVNEFIKGRVDSNVLDAMQRRDEDELKDRQAFRQEMRDFARRVELQLDTVVRTMRPFGQRLTALEGNCNANHDHLPLASVPPSSRRGAELEPEVESAAGAEALEG